MNQEKKVELKRKPTSNDQIETINHIGPAAHLIQHPYRLGVAGRSTMGKTTLAVDIIRKCLIKDVRRCFAVCPTFWEQPSLAPLRRIKGAFTKNTVFTRVDDTVFVHIWNELKRRPAPTLLLVDDAAAESATNKGNKGAFSRLCLAAPHLNLSIVGCFQRFTAASPAFRDNAEGLIAFQPSRVGDVKTIVDEYNPCPARKGNRDLINSVLEQAWRDHMFAFIHRVKRGPILIYAGLDHQVSFNCDGDNEQGQTYIY
jgi:hypothetical protein